MKEAIVICAMICTACVHEVRTVRPETEQGSSQSTSHSTCFSPDEACDKKLIEFIRSAQRSLDIAVFDITHPQIVHEILVASKRVRVRMVVDKRQAKGHHSLVSTLLRAGLDLRTGQQRGIMHHKFVIVDNSALETGSFNYTVGASFKNHENQVYLFAPEIVNRFTHHFESMWKEARALRN